MTTMRPGLARPGLVQRQAASLAMTPRMQQAVRLLQVTGQELDSVLAEAVEANPVLRLAGDGGERPAVAPAPSSDRLGSDTLLARPDGHAAAADRPLDTDYGNVYGGEPRSAGPGRGEEDLPGIDQTLAEAPTLSDHLSAQAGLAFSEAGDRLLAEHLIGALDGAGWLTEPPEEIADRLGCPRPRMARILRVCRDFEPTGVFARSLADCLSLQLAEADRLDPAMRRLLGRLDLVAKRDLTALSRLCGVDLDDVADMIAEIRRLDPKPGARFRPETAATRIPEVIVRPAPPAPREGAAPAAAPHPDWIVELNDAALPRLLIDRRYRAEISARGGGARDVEARAYLRRCLDDARWLIRALDRRATTLLAVASAIVARQDAFLRHGVTHLRPMVLRDVAADAGLHESTVSRVVAGKTMATPRGLVAMKALFTQGLTGGGRDAPATSAEAVRHRIRALIDVEERGAPLSDDRIAAILEGEGVAIARRTVAKYREGMGIPSSAQRRRDAAIAGARAARR